MKRIHEGFILSFFQEPDSPTLSEGELLTDVVMKYAPKAALAEKLKDKKTGYSYLGIFVDLLHGEPSPEAVLVIAVEDFPLALQALASYSSSEKLFERIKEVRQATSEPDASATISYLESENFLARFLIMQLETFYEVETGT